MSPVPYRLIVLLSSERSGSTLLRVMLGEHKQIIAPQELFLLRYRDYASWRRDKPIAMKSLLEIFDLIGKPKTVRHLDTYCACMTIDEVLTWILDTLPLGYALLDKTPSYANEISTLKRAEKFQPYYIWLVRHPLGVVESHMRVSFQQDGPTGVRLLLYLVQRKLEALFDSGMSRPARAREAKWVSQNKNIQRFLATIPDNRQSFMVFERLVQVPEREMARLCTELGISLKPTMLHPFDKYHPSEWDISDGNFNTRSKIDPSTADKWGNCYPEAVLRPETKALMAELGIQSAGSSILRDDAVGQR